MPARHDFGVYLRPTKKAAMAIAAVTAAKTVPANAAVDDDVSTPTPITGSELPKKQVDQIAGHGFRARGRRARSG